MKAKPQILLVEDERITAEDIQRTLTYLGYSVCSMVSSARKAIREVEKNRPDLILMDIRLRGKMDGVEAARRIHARFDIPIVYITGFAEEATLKRAKKTEPFGYLQKPIGEKELQATIEMALYKHKMERKLKESEERFRQFFENRPDYCYMISPGGVILDVNRAALDALGYKENELIGKPLQTIYAPESRQKMKRYLTEWKKTARLQNKEMVIISKEGNRRTVLLNADAVKDENGKILYSVSAQIDITERKKAEKARRESEEKYRVLVENATDFIYMIDKNFKILSVNKAATRLCGKEPRKLAGKSIFDLFPKKIATYYSKNIKKVFESGKSSLHESRMVVGGRESWVSNTLSPVRDHKGKIVAVMGISRDITQHKRAEEEKERLFAELVQSEKIAGVGTLAGGIAHEFNNLFQIIRGHTEFAQETKRPEDIEEAFDIVLYNIDKAAKIVRDLLAFSSQDPSEYKSCDVAELIELVLSLTEEHFKKLNIKVVKKYGRTPRIDVNRGEIQQVFLNLITNARDAMLPEGGKLVIIVKQIKENVEVKFIDTGKGIKKKNLGKVFEPFYTTKGALGGDSKIKGTGLGLSASYGIMKHHGGTIEVESMIGRGTTFTVKLPVKGRGTKGRYILGDEKREMGKPEPLNILVVDDEAEICSMFTKFLSSDGHRVKSALNGKKALDLIGREYFDIVFLDIVIPGIPTIKVLEKIKNVSPKTEVVMMTGKLMDKNLINDFKQKGGSSVLQKPFKIDDIMKIIKAWKKKMNKN